MLRWGFGEPPQSERETSRHWIDEYGDTEKLVLSREVRTRPVAVMDCDAPCFDLLDRCLGLWRAEVVGRVRRDHSLAGAPNEWLATIAEAPADGYLEVPVEPHGKGPNRMALRELRC